MACRIIGGDQSPIHRSTLYRGIRAGRFPAPIKIGIGTNRWRASELIALIEAAAAARKEAAPGDWAAS
jgi:predicted DNA-binding transcriptional regulator AlpA